MKKEKGVGGRGGGRGVGRALDTELTETGGEAKPKKEPDSRTLACQSCSAPPFLLQYSFRFHVFPFYPPNICGL